MHAPIGEWIGRWSWSAAMRVEFGGDGVLAPRRRSSRTLSLLSSVERRTLVGETEEGWRVAVRRRRRWGNRRGTGIRWGRTRGRCASRGGADAVSQLRAVGHHLSRAPGRARRVEAGPAPHPLHDVAAEPDRRRQAPQVREGRRRRDGQLSPPRRHRALRNAGPDGPALLAPLPARRRLRELRLARRRQCRGDALHRMPASAPERRAVDRNRSDARFRSAPTTTAPRPSRSSCRRACRTS